MDSESQIANGRSNSSKKMSINSLSTSKLTGSNSPKPVAQPQDNAGGSKK